MITLVQLLFIFALGGGGYYVFSQWGFAPLVIYVIVMRFVLVWVVNEKK